MHGNHAVRRSSSAPMTLCALVVTPMARTFTWDVHSTKAIYCRPKLFPIRPLLTCRTAVKSIRKANSNCCDSVISCGSSHRMVQFQKVLSKSVAQLTASPCTRADAYTKAPKHRAKCKLAMVACTFHTMAKRLGFTNMKSWFQSDLLLFAATNEFILKKLCTFDAIYNE